jgi:plastocyanin
VESNNGLPLFTYAATADNTTQDPVLVVGVEDEPAPPGFHPSTPTPAGSGTTPTPTPPGATTHVVNIGQNGNSFKDSTGGGSSTTIHVGDTVKWVWMGGSHSTTSGTCTSGGYYGGDCSGDGRWDSGTMAAPSSFSLTFTTPGTFKYFCDVHQGGMTGTVQVQP